MNIDLSKKLAVITISRFAFWQLDYLFIVDKEQSVCNNSIFTSENKMFQRYYEYLLSVPWLNAGKNSKSNTHFKRFSHVTRDTLWKPCERHRAMVFIATTSGVHCSNVMTHGVYFWKLFPQLQTLIFRCFLQLSISNQPCGVDRSHLSGLYFVLTIQPLLLEIWGEILCVVFLLVLYRLYMNVNIPYFISNMVIT